jgi:hypothetical protein
VNENFDALINKLGGGAGTFSRTDVGLTLLWQPENSVPISKKTRGTITDQLLNNITSSKYS